MGIHYSGKPMIYLLHPKDISLERIVHVGYGIEEEGRPYKFFPISEAGNVIDCAHRAAQESQLLVGIACDEKDLVLHYRNLPLDFFMYRIKDYQSVSNRVLRLFGSNAARLVKGIPFKESTALDTSF